MGNHFRKMKTAVSILVISLFILTALAMTFVRAESICDSSREIVYTLRERIDALRISYMFSEDRELSEQIMLDACRTYTETLKAAADANIAFYGTTVNQEGTVLAEAGNFAFLACYGSDTVYWSNQDDELFQKVIDLDTCFTAGELKSLGVSLNEISSASVFAKISGLYQGMFVFPAQIDLLSGDYSRSPDFARLEAELMLLEPRLDGFSLNAASSSDVSITGFSNDSSVTIQLHWDGESLTKISENRPDNGNIIETSSSDNVPLFYVKSYVFTPERQEDYSDLSMLTDENSIYILDIPFTYDYLFGSFSKIPPALAEAKSYTDRWLRLWKTNKASVSIDNQGNELSQFINLFTYYLGSTGYVDGQLFAPYVFVFHPLADAARELAGIYIFSGVLLVVVLYTMARLIDSTRKKQEQLDISHRQLTRAIAHELKTPLGIISCYSEGLLDPLSESKKDDYARVIADETQHMNKLILDMLELSRLEAGERTLQVEEIDLVQMLASIVARFEPLLAQQKIRVHLDAPDEALVEGDLNGLMAVVGNFLSNAIKHTSAGHSITMRIAPVDGYYLTEVVNEGEPIHPDKINRLWDNFYKGDDARSHFSGSSGLGLSIARNILTLHGDAFGCTNIQDGVCFWFKHRKKTLEESAAFRI